MAIRIEEPNLWQTERLLEQVLGPLVREDERVAFLCDAGEGEKIVQRLRVMMSRTRGKLEAKGKKVKKFRLHSTIHPETHSGKRFDCIVMWKTTNEIHVMSQEIEDILVNG